MINKINKLSKSEFVKVFANIFENASWIAAELYNQKPFNDFKELSSKMLNIFELGNNYQSQILELYNQYRDEILKKNIENNTYIKEIDRILKNRFQI